VEAEINADAKNANIQAVPGNNRRSCLLPAIAIACDRSCEHRPPPGLPSGHKRSVRPHPGCIA